MLMTTTSTTTLTLSIRIQGIVEGWLLLEECNLDVVLVLSWLLCGRETPPSSKHGRGCKSELCPDKMQIKIKKCLSLLRK